MKRWILALAAASIATVFACSDDDHDHDHDQAAGGGHTSPYPDCNAITQACHEVDVEEGPIHTCHDSAHAATSNADCAPIKENCLKICNEAKVDGGGHHDEDGG